MDQFVAVRDDECHVGRPEFEQLREGRDDDGFAEAGRERNELCAKPALTRLDNCPLRLDLIRAQLEGTEIQV